MERRRGHGRAAAGGDLPRAYIDANRAPDEIDELLLDRPWPGAVNASPKVRLGKGLIWRMLDDGTPLYDRKLPVEEVEHRIAACWKPYHAALRQLLDGAHRKFGRSGTSTATPCPAWPAPTPPTSPAWSTPISCWATATAAPATRPSANSSRPGCARGYHVTVNDPYKGVELVRAFGCPAEGRHSLQIEINRKLYMDEVSLRPTRLRPAESRPARADGGADPLDARADGVTLDARVRAASLPCKPPPAPLGFCLSNSQPDRIPALSKETAFARLIKADSDSSQ